MEVFARYGTQAQKDRWLQPLLNGKIRSAFAMTERFVASSDAKNIKLSIRKEGNEIVLNGHKWWISGAGDPRCAVHLVMGQRCEHLACVEVDVRRALAKFHFAFLAHSDPENPDAYKRQSMVIVPADTKGVNIIRPCKIMGQDDAPEG